jgi:hypothetical protein
MIGRLILGIELVAAICVACIPPIDGCSVVLVTLGLIALLCVTIFWQWIEGE